MPGESKSPHLTDAENHVINLHKNENVVPLPVEHQPRQRYSLFWWNSHSQHCYKNNEVALLERVRADFASIVGMEKAAHYFATTIENKWQGHWSCTTPTNFQYDSKDSFTLPHRPHKDIKIHPLWNFAENAARELGNWQSERTGNDELQRHNDPFMLVIHILRQEFYNDIANLEANRESISYINKLQAFVKAFLYQAKDYGSDRVKLFAIQTKLTNAIDILENAITQKELPRLLTDMITSGKTIETYIGANLHYLGHETVADKDNFSVDHFEGKRCHLTESPVCKLFAAAKNSKGEYASVNRFYNYTVTEVEGEKQIGTELRMEMMHGIKLNSNVNPPQYLELTATLESLINIRKIVEDFQSIQEDIGNHNFALKFVDDTKSLAINYIELINKAQALLVNLKNAADLGIKLNNQENPVFEENLRLLETRATKDMDLTKIVTNAICSIQRYQHAMESLVKELSSGQASRAVEKAILKISTQMQKVNQITPALLEDVDVTVENAKYENMTLETTTEKVYEEAADYWTDKQIDPVSQKPLYTLTRYADHHKKEILGTITFHNEQALCVTEDGSRTNIHHATGIFKHLKNIDPNKIERICDVAPPNLLDRMYYHTKTGAWYGSFTAISNLVAFKLNKKKFDEEYVNIMKDLTYYGCIYGFNFYTYYVNALLLNNSAEAVNLLINAAFSTSQLYVINTVLNYVVEKLKPNVKVQTNSWQAACTKYAPKLLYLAYGTVKNGFFEAASSTASGIAVETALEYAGKKIL